MAKTLNKKMKPLVIDGHPIRLEDIVDVSMNGREVRIGTGKDFRRAMERSRRLLADAIRDGVPVYGVTTGFGRSCGKRLTRQEVLKNGGSSPLYFHGCGTGEPIGIEATRAAMLCRMIGLARGYSGVSVALLERMARFLNEGITPVVPCEGSVGASGDLTPMSYVAAALIGEREVFYHGMRMPAAQAVAEVGIPPYSFESKEALSLMNGTATMTGIAVLAADRARRILDAVVGATALTVHALRGKSSHFHAAAGEAKPHPGQVEVARCLRDLLETKAGSSAVEADAPETLQDPYSVRCVPQVVGVLADALAWIVPWIETEANSANDNPIFDPAGGPPVMSGNFYGGHIAFAADALKTAVASVADLSDRQVALLVDPHTNRGLPADLVRANGREILLRHGFKALSLAISALAAEALKLTMPAGSFSRPTESNNQDKVSMGTIAARDAERVCTLAERAAAIHLLAAVQACEIRGNTGIRPRLNRWIRAVRRLSPAVMEDREMDRDIETIVAFIARSAPPA